MRGSGRQQETRVREWCGSRGLELCARGLWLVLALVVGAPFAGAQGQTSGALGGVVVDAGVAAVEVDLESIATGQRLTTRTNAGGRFLFIALAPGRYRVTPHVPGMEADSFEATVGLDATTELTLTMRSPRVKTEVTVTAESQESGASVRADLIGRPEIDALPLDGRRWQSFAFLTPQATPATDDLDLISFSGLTPMANSTRLDGVDDDQSYSGTPRGSGQESGKEAEDESEVASPVERGYAAGDGAGRHPGMLYSFSEAAVREFRVTGQNDSALYGHAAGGVITTVSRSGTEEQHGSLFYLTRSDAFAATDPFAVASRFHDGVVTSGPVRPHDLRQQYGGTISGAAVPKRLFYFYALDLLRRGFPGVASPQSATFYSLTAMQKALLGNRGVTAAKTVEALNYLDSLTGRVTRRQDQTVNFGKLDWQARADDRFSLEYNRARSSGVAGARTAAVVDRGAASFGNTEIRVDSGIGRWIHTFGARMSNEVRGQYGRDLHQERPQMPLPQEPAIGPGGLAPEVAIGPDGFTFGTPASSSQGPSPDERRTQAAEILTVARGSHLLQLGGDFSYVQDHVESLANAAGTFRYDSGLTNGHAGGLVDWITDYTFSVNSYPSGGCPGILAALHYSCFRSFSQSFGGEETRFATQEWAGFVQDDWRVSQGVSLSLGIRYEYELLPLPQRPNAVLDAAFGATGASSVFPEDRNNFGPRLGVSWRPFGSEKSVLRGGYGVYFGRLAGATVRSALAETALPMSTTSIRILPTFETACPQVANQGFGYPCAFLTAPPSGVVSTTSAEVFDRRFRLPTSQQGTVSVEQEIGRGATLRGTYLLNLTRQLPNSTDINIAPATGMKSFQLVGGGRVAGLRDGDTFSLPVYTARVNTAFGPVTDVISNVNASYHALLVEGTYRGRGGLRVRASWTWSKSIDYGQNPGAAPPTDGQLDPFDVRYEKGISSMNRPHKVVVSAPWEPRPTVARGWERAVVSGWTFAPVLVEGSGRPYSYNIFGGTRLAGGHESINGSGGSVYLPTVGRNVLRLPEQVDVDLRVAREVPVTERWRLRLTADIFNLPNRTNVSAVVERAFVVGTPANGYTPLVFQDAATVSAEGLNTLPFGTYNGVSQGQARERQMQLGARLEF